MFDLVLNILIASTHCNSLICLGKKGMYSLLLIMNAKSDFFRDYVLKSILSPRQLVFQYRDQTFFFYALTSAGPPGRH